MRDPQALGEQQLQLVAEPPAPMAQVGALVREAVLEELLAGEVLKIGVVDPALAQLLIGQREDVLEQQKPHHEAGCCAGRPRSLKSGAIWLSSQSQSSLPAICTSSCFMLMIWSSGTRNRSLSPVVACFFGRIVPPPMQHRIIVRPERESQK
jgi:hypothetical protein